MANVSPDHLAQPRRPFVFGCSTEVFPADELQALSEHGSRMEALSAGEMPPETSEEEHVLLVDREEAEPSTVTERAWVRLKGRREYEREQAAAPPPRPREDYGIVEWDADRCWW